MRISRLSGRLVAVDASSWYGDAPVPTGESKTLPALLIADHALTRGWSVAYLTGKCPAVRNSGADRQRQNCSGPQSLSVMLHGASLDRAGVDTSCQIS